MIGKEEVQLSLFADNVIAYVEYLMESTKNATKINQWIYQGYKIENQLKKFNCIPATNNQNWNLKNITT